jgi:hypothetical protein
MAEARTTIQSAPTLPLERYEGLKGMAPGVSVGCYVFISTTATAFTMDHTGDNLPTNRGPWCYVRRAGDQQLRRSEITEVIRGLQADGFAIVSG